MWRMMVMIMIRGRGIQTEGYNCTKILTHWNMKISHLPYKLNLVIEAVPRAADFERFCLFCQSVRAGPHLEKYKYKDKDK